MKQSLAILDAYLDDELTDDERRQFEAWINEDPANIDQFVDACCIDSCLQDIFREEQVAHDAMGAYAGDGDLGEARRDPGGAPLADWQPVSQQNALPLGIFLDPSMSAAPSPSPGVLFPAIWAAVGRFSASWPAAYLIATILFGLGLSIAALIHVSQPSRQDSLARQPSNSLPIPNTSPIVARITGMADCVWGGSGFGGQGSGATDQKSEIRNQKSLLHLGDRLALRSGLLEITYNTGATVILQGPITYEVESRTGGYLARGKLTARLEKKSEFRGRKSESANQISEITNHQFAVRTPTAVVTDLGTEFGVEVSKAGNTSTHVFRGVVQVQSAGNHGDQQGQTVRVIENESVHVKKQAGHLEMTVRRGTGDGAAFVRVGQLPKVAEEERTTPLQRWQAYSQQLRKDPALVAYYTFESAGKDITTLPNLSAAGSALDGRITGGEWVPGRLPGKFALYFHGKGCNETVILPGHKRFNFTQSFSIGVWFHIVEFSPDVAHGLITSGTPAWLLQRFGSTNYLTIGPGTDEQYKVMPHTDVFDGRWHLAVAVIEPRNDSHRKCLYIDGCKDSEIKIPAPLGQNNDTICVGHCGAYSWREFYGRIDEVAIFSRALLVKEIAAMFEAGNPGDTRVKKAIGKGAARTVATSE